MSTATDKVSEKVNNGWGWFFLLLLIVQIGIVIFGAAFKADKSVIKDTLDAKNKFRQALFFAFQDYGQLEVRQDYSLHVYIPKENYSKVNYPDMDSVIAEISAIWCSNKGINSWYLPKVLYRDIKTGEELKVYRCLLK